MLIFRDPVRVRTGRENVTPVTFLRRPGRLRWVRWPGSAWHRVRRCKNLWNQLFL